jgi:hypothetical protein
MNRMRSGIPRWHFTHWVLNGRWRGKSMARRLIGKRRRDLVRDRLNAFMRSETLSPEDKTILCRFYRPTLHRLSEMIGMDFSDWCCATPSAVPVHDET